MTLRASYDDGRTWPYSTVVYKGPSAYCDLAVLPDGNVGLLFEKDGYQTIEFVTIPTPPVELESALENIDMQLYEQSEADIRAWLDARIAQYGEFGVYPDLLGHAS